MILDYVAARLRHISEFRDDDGMSISFLPPCRHVADIV
jgi:hypothetical protein